MNSLSIIGVGWLGKQVLESLSDAAIEVFALGRSLPESIGNRGLKLDLNANDLFLDQKAACLNSDCFLFTIPPSGISNPSLVLNRLFKRIRSQNPQARLILTSSIGVYAGLSGNLTEEAELQANSKRAASLLEIESLVFQNFKNKGTVLRLGGLVGPGRHPIHSLSGKTKLAGGQQAVNLVHSADILQVVKLALDLEDLPQIINVVSPMHPRKEAYYARVAENLGLTKPEYDSIPEENPRKIDSINLKALNFNFLYPDPEQYPEAKN